MNMPAKNNYRIPLEIALWLCLYVLWVLVFQNRTITISRTMGVEFCYLVFIALNYYAIVYLFITRFLKRKQYFQFLFLYVISTAMAALLRAVVSYFITLYLYHFPVPDMGKLFPASVLNIFIWTSVLVAGKMIIDRLTQQRMFEEIEREKVKTELEFLKAQHNPHFLFNSLNSLYFQIDKGNADARGTLMKLSDMLRYQLYECNADSIAIEKELQYLGSYIELQKLRLGDKYKIEYKTEESVRGFSIAPLLIIPLVENAFKYISHHEKNLNEINIKLDYTKGIFVCEIENTTERKKEEVSGGIGLVNLTRRLELLYAEDFELVTEAKAEKFYATLKIRINEN